MKNWDVTKFNTVINNYKKQIIINRHSAPAKSEDYNLAQKMEIYRYLAEVVLRNEVAPGTIIGWTQEDSPGPRDIEHVSRLEKFLRTPLIKVEKGNETMKAKYSMFTKERVYEVHKAMCAYFNEYGEEESFWTMCDAVEQASVTLPVEVYIAIQGFIDQYLEEDLFGAIMSRKERVEFDLTDMEASDKVCPNPEVGEYHVQWFKMKNMYDNIVEKYIRPVVGAE